MTKSTITLGETYSIALEPRDASGTALVMDGTWQAACRVIAKTGGATILDELAMTISDGIASLEIDTGEAPWVAGVYIYDVRITDPDGHDAWSEKVQLTLAAGITPKSV